MKVLVYTRPRIDVFFKKMVESIPVFEDVQYFSDHVGTEEIDVMREYYDVKADILNGSLNMHESWEDLNFSDVAVRCRYLRSLSEDHAELRIKAMSVALWNIIERTQPDYMFGMVMDSYVLDLCDRLMRKRGGQYLGFLNNMVNGYSRLTSRGELIYNEEPSDVQVEEAISSLRSKFYVPNMQRDFMWKTTPWSMFFSKLCKEMVKIIYYAAKKVVDKDPDNFYSNTVASKHCMSCRGVGQLFFRRFQRDGLGEFVTESRAAGKTVVYLPLQFYPECSLDYWGTSTELSDFYSVVSELLSLDLENCVVLVKEHPSAYGLRKSDFYRQFSNNSDFFLVPFDMSSNDVIEMSDAVLTWTGSVGVEAVVRNKPLVTLGSAYYADSSVPAIERKVDLLKIEEIIAKAIEHHDDTGDLHVFMGNMLKGLTKGYIFPLDYGTSANPYNLAEMNKLGGNLSKQISALSVNGIYPVRDGTLN